ncbi:hypothetical protein AL073_15055 [Loktanella sp. 1ANDIMAR09]|nr:hypothetical protein AL073_15055 [Loktanella sp. 1ANDIMAR09]
MRIQDTTHLLTDSWPQDKLVAVVLCNILDTKLIHDPAPPAVKWSSANFRKTEDTDAGCLDNFGIGARTAIKGVADRIELIARDGAADAAIGAKLLLVTRNWSGKLIRALRNTKDYESELKSRSPPVLGPAIK